MASIAASANPFTVHGLPARLRAGVRLCLVALLAVTLAGCGYKLRGSQDAGASGRDLYVDGPAWLTDELDVLVESGGGDVLAKRSDGVASVHMRDESFERRVISVDSRTGKSREFELAYNLFFDLRDDAGAKVLENERISLLRDLTLDPDAVLGKVSEERVLRDEMRRDAASQLLRRVESVLGD